MKKTLFTVLAMTILSLTYGQEIKAAKEEFNSAKETMAKDFDKIMTLKSDRIIIENRLELEADSAQFYQDKNLLIAFGTKSFSFKGKVIADKDNRTYKFYLDEHSPTTLIVEE